MITLIKWIGYVLVKPYMSNRFMGVSGEEFMKLDYFVNGPDYLVTLWIDLLILGLGLITILILMIIKYSGEKK